jgi:hypothetical protein
LGIFARETGICSQCGAHAILNRFGAPAASGPGPSFQQTIGASNGRLSRSYSCTVGAATENLGIQGEINERIASRLLNLRSNSNNLIARCKTLISTGGSGLRSSVLHGRQHRPHARARTVQKSWAFVSPMPSSVGTRTRPRSNNVTSHYGNTHRSDEHTQRPVGVLSGNSTVTRPIGGGSNEACCVEMLKTVGFRNLRTVGRVAASVGSSAEQIRSGRATSDGGGLTRCTCRRR